MGILHTPHPTEDEGARQFKDDNWLTFPVGEKCGPKTVAVRRA